MDYKTEDKVSEEAGKILGLVDSENAKAGVGQLTTFNELDFRGVSDKPDGWYFPKNKIEPALILEVKNSKIDISKQKCIEELKKNINIAHSKYDKVIGILYNGEQVLVYKDDELIITNNQLFNKNYYLKLYNQNTIDKTLIYDLTSKINNNLHYNFGINNLKHRMIFTACALVAKRYGAILVKGMSWEVMHNSILSTLSKSYEEAKKQNEKLSLIGEEYSYIQCNYIENQDAIDDFIECVEKISDNINSDYWNGEDVMGIFFNEFNRYYKGKKNQGQVFTPDHITSLMYRITGTSYKDNVLDACCGSGAFLTKAMSNMIKEVGGVNNDDAVRKIKTERLYGVELDKGVFALACANMLIHKDGKTNIIQDDTRMKSVCNWIKSKNITKVLMNPPYERKHKCLKIVENVLDNVSDGAICAFLLPDTKLEQHRNTANRLLSKHSLLKIIKLPDIFAGMASNSTSIFIFKANEKHNNKPIFACWIKDDGFETLKNKGRHDVKNKWQDIENYWVDVIYKQSGDSTVIWLNAEDKLCYPIKEDDFLISDKDFKQCVISSILYNAKIDEIKLHENLMQYLLWGEKSMDITDGILSYINKPKTINNIDTTEWKGYSPIKLFTFEHPSPRSSKNYEDGNIPFVYSGCFNNGVEKFVNPKDEILDKGGCISLSPVDCSAFYQENDFLGRGGGGSSVYLLRNDHLNKYNALFICAVLKKFYGKYYYDNQLSETKFKKEQLYLPYKTDDEPNWLYMENYIKNLYKELEVIIK